MDKAVIAHVNAGWESSEARINGDKELIRVTRQKEENTLAVVLSHLRAHMGNDKLNDSLVWTVKG